MLNLPIKILDKIVVDVETVDVTFENIDTLVAQWDALAHVTSRHLVLIIDAKTIDPADSNTNFMYFNGSFPAMDYMYQRLSGVDATSSAGRVDGANAINLPPIAGANQAYMFGGSLILIPHAFNTVNHKAVLALGGSGEFTVEAVAARWAQAAAITSVTLLQGVGDEYVVGSKFLLGVIDERYLVEEIADAGGGTFDNIPQGEGDLVAIGYLRSALAAVEDEVAMAINDDTVAGNYPTQELVGRGAARTAAQPTFEVGIVSAANATANVFGALAMSISQYTKNNFSHWLSQNGYHESTGPTGEVRVMTCRQSTIEPINKLYFAGANALDDFAAGSLLSLYRVPKRLIERVELTVDQHAITFANIPQYFEALILHVYARHTRGVAWDSVVVTLNGDADAANYDTQRVYGAGGGLGAERLLANQAWMSLPGDTAPTHAFAGGTLLLPAYNRADGHKHGIAIYGNEATYMNILSVRWESNAPITSIVLEPPLAWEDFLPGSVFELEGILRKEGLPADAGMRIGIP